MKKYASYILSLVLLTLWIGIPAGAQEFKFLPDKYVNPYYSKNIKVNGGSPTSYGDVLGTTSADEWAYMTNYPGTWSQKYQFKSVSNYIKLAVDQESKAAVANYKYQVTLQVKGYADPSNPGNFTTQNYTMVLEYNKDSLSKYKDAVVLKMPGAGFFSFNLTLVDVMDISGSTPVSVPRASLASNFYIQAEVVTQRYDKEENKKNVFINSQYNSASQELEVRWGNYFITESNYFPPGYLPPFDHFKPVKYELEWTYVDDYKLNNYNHTAGSTGYLNTASTFSVPYSFKNNATRIQTDQNYFKIPVIYGHGVIVFRIRKIRPDSVNYNTAVYYDWNLPESGMLTNNSFGTSALYTNPNRAPSNCMYVIESPHQSDSMNWQYNISFAEEGKYKHVIHYFDGMGKNRQTQTRINSDEDYVVGVDNIYDFEGRPAITTLPVPIQAGNLAYKPNLSLHAGTLQPYKAQDFDTGCVQDTLLPFAATALANMYYSAQNPDKGGMQQFVPDAQGYPFIQTIYSPDYTDKVLWQGGAGATFQRGKGHGTRYAYVRAGQKELNRLFGTESGYFQYYPKQVTLDPNGQASFAIVDAAGKTIATALAGAAPSDQQYPISALPDMSPATYTMQDVLSGNPQNIDKYARKAEYSYYNESPGYNGLRYGVDIAPFPTGCNNQFIHAAGKYTFKIIDECGGQYLSQSNMAGANEIGANSQHKHFSGAKDSVNLVPGKYTIIKELSFSDSAIRSLASAFVDSNAGQGKCYAGPETFVRKEVESAVFPCVSGDTLNACDALRQRLKSELYPGAKYGQYVPDAQGNFAAGVDNSIFTYYSLYDSMNIAWVATSNPQAGDRCSYRVRIDGWNEVHDPNSNYTGNLGPGVTYVPYTLYDTIVAAYPYPSSYSTGGDHPTTYTVLNQFNCQTRDTIYPNAVNIGKCLYEVRYEGFCTVPGATSPYSFGTTKEVWASSPAQIPTSTIMTQSVFTNNLWHQISCPVYLDTSSIQVLQCIDGDPYYRYQSECLDAATVAVTQTDIYGQMTTSQVPLELATPEQLIAGFNDSLAETLLPLHPEYCKLLACDTGNFEARLSQVETYEQAVAWGLHTLSGITAQDPMCTANKPAAPFSAGQLSYFEADAQLSSANAQLLKRFDSMAVAMAYCGCNAAEATIYCREVQYRNQINNMVLAGAQIKDQYIKSLKSLYLANRGLLKQRLTDAAGTHCGPCDTLRMTLIGQPNFVNVFDASGNVNSEHIPQEVRDLINNRMHNTTDTSRPSLVNDQVNMHTQNFCQSQVGQIIDDLQSCGTLNHSEVAMLSNYLEGYCTPGSMGENISPDALRSILLSMGKLDDLCQPFMTKYGLFSKQHVVEKGRYIAKAPAFYQGLNDFMNRYEVTNALLGAQASGSTVYSPVLSASNVFEKELLDSLGLGSSATVNVQGFVHTYPVSAGNTLQATTYKLVLSGGGQTDTLFLAARSLPGNDERSPLTETDPLGNSLSTYIAFSNTHSAVRDSMVYALAEGGIADHVAFLNLDKTIVNHTMGTTRNAHTWYSLWSHRLPMLAPRGPGGVAECVNCELLRRTVSSYYSDAATYSLPVNAAHPFYAQSLQNYLNYKLQKKHGIEAYEALMRGCALSDEISMPAAPATIQATFAGTAAGNFGPATSFVQGLQQAYPDNRIDYFMYQQQGNHNIVVWFDLRSVPDLQKVKAIKDYIMTNTPGGGAIYLPAAHTADVFRYGAGSFPISGANTTSESVRLPLADGTYADATHYMVDAITTTPLAIANVQQAVRDQVQDHAGYAKVSLGHKLYRSSDYSQADKQAYLSYVYSLGSLSDHEVAGRLAPVALQQEIPAFADTALTLSYNSPWCSDSKRDLYYWNHNQGSHSGFQRLQTVLGQVKAVLGSNKLFPAAGSVNISGGSGLNNSSVKAFRQGNGGAWYRVFDASNKLYNIYLAPSDSMLAPAQEYQMVSVSPSLYTAEGAGNVYRFNVVMQKGSHRVTVYGYTDFPIATGSKLQDVVLQDNFGQSLQCLDTASCERSTLLTAIEQGLQQHYAYIDSAKTQLRNAMAWHFPQQASDTLYHSMQSQQYHYTLYYYDLAGNLTRTVPPQGVQPLSVATAAGVDAARSSNSGAAQLSLKPAHNKRSEYRYNSFNQLVWQQIPDGGITEFFYDKAGRLVFSQNAVQRAAKKYSYTLYDDQSRPIETGQIVGDSSLATGQHPAQVSHAIDYSMNGAGGTADWVRAKTREEVVATRYDEALISLSGYDNMLSPQENLRKRVSVVLYSPVVTTQMSIDSYYHYASHFSYDAMGNVKTLTQDNPYMDYVKQRFKRIDYDYDLLSGKVNMLSYNRGFADQYYQRYEYDADNRLLKAYSSKDGILWDRDAAYTYYKHGPLAEAQYGDLNVQGIQYAYTIQGWLKAINGDVLNSAEDMGQDGYAGSVYPADVMAHKLDYYAGDYKAIAPSATVSHMAEPGRSLYNGNIVRQTTATAGSSNMIRAYSYDQLHRIKQTDYSLYDNISHAVSSMANNAYKNTYSYDADGNLQTLTRHNAAGTLIDNFTYHYSNPAQNNKLDYVADAAAYTGGNDLKSNQAAGNYSYDALGNLKRDVAEGIKDIRWSAYGKMLELSKGTVQDDTMQLHFSYDGMGNRIRKDYWQNIGGGSSNSLRTSDIYVRDAQGNILAVYKETAHINGGSTIDWLNDQLMTAVPMATATQFLLERVGSSGPFVSDLLHNAVVNHSPWSDAQLDRPSGFYLGRSDELYRLALQQNLAAAYGDIVTANWQYIGDACRPDNAHNIATNLLDVLTTVDYDEEARIKTLSYLVTENRELGNGILSDLGYPTDEKITDGQKVSFFTEYIAVNGSRSLAEAFESQVRFKELETSKFWQAVLQDPIILNESLLNSYTSVSDVLLAGLGRRSEGANQAVVDYLSDWIDRYNSKYISENFSKTDRLNVVYESDKAVFLQSYITDHGIGDVSQAIRSIPGVTSITYSGWITGAAQLGQLPMSVMAFVNTPNPQNIDADTLYLAEHHLYGSSRLGIKYYDKEQYRNIYVPGQAVVQGASVKVPWYSMAYEELIKKGVRNPLSMGDRLTDTLKITRDLGTKEYELTDHLGNVLANVLDRKTGYGSNGTLYTGFRADVASTTDYYPFGFAMQERTTDANSFANGSKMGYNGQLRTDEIAGTGNHNTALFWEYDTRVARRWNVDPVDQINISNYAVNGLNPVIYNDPLGDDFIAKNGQNWRAGDNITANSDGSKIFCTGLNRTWDYGVWNSESENYDYYNYDLSKNLMFSGGDASIGGMILGGALSLNALRTFGNKVPQPSVTAIQKGLFPLGPLNAITTPYFTDLMNKVDNIDYDIAFKKGYKEFINVIPRLKTVNFQGIYVNEEEAKDILENGLNISQYNNRIQPIGPSDFKSKEYKYLIFFNKNSTKNEYTMVDHLTGKDYVPVEKIDQNKIGLIPVED